MKEPDRKKYLKPARRMARRAVMTLALLLTAATASAQYGPLELRCFICEETYLYIEYTVKFHPTCSDPGEAMVNCIKCFKRHGKTNAQIPALGHDWGKNDGWHYVTASCTQGHHDERTCHRCGKTETRPFNNNVTSPLGHAWGTTTHHDATCTEAEHDERTCNRCGEREVTNINGNALGHNFENSICTRCGKIGPIDFSDNAANDLTTFNGKKTDVTLSGRKIYGDNNWNTLCLPFALTAEQIAASPLSGAVIMALDGTTSNLTGGTLTLNFSPVTSIEAGKPHIIRMVKGKDGATAPTYTVGNGSSGHEFLIDRSTDDSWGVQVSELPYCEFQADKPVYVTGYTLNANKYHYTGHPTIWTLKAKLNEADDWTTIDSRNTNENSGDALSREASKSYTISTPSLYQYFRIDVTQVNSGYYLYIAELTMHSFYPENAYIDDPKFNEVTITATEPVAVTFGNNGTADEAKKCRFVGNYSPFSITDGNIDEIVYLGSDNTIGYATAARMLRNFRAHFEIPTLTAGTRAVTRTVLDFSGHSDGTTGIKEVKSEGVKSEKSGVEGWFSLDGRRLNGRPSAKGLYIHNGRKEVVR